MPRNKSLRQHRMQQNLRQQDIAEQLGVTRVTIQRWERGIQQPSAYHRMKLCELLGLSAQELGLVEEIPPFTPTISAKTEAEPAPVDTSREVALWAVPYMRNPHFTGRDDLLSHLAQQLSPTAAGQSDLIRQVALTQAQAIKGLGGVGKTQIAVEYAYRAREQSLYTHTLWINASSEEAILTSFATLADLLPAFATKSETDQPKLAAAVISWLEQCEKPWLLIMDNTDDLSLVMPYLPRQSNGSLLLTTRANAVGSFASSIDVEMMSMMEGIQLLLRRAQRLAHASDDEINEAGNIVVALAQFPLAIDQAGAYIEETGSSLRDYLHLYQERQYTLLKRRGRHAMTYPESVATTWSLSFQQVGMTNPAATELLRLCALLAPDFIPEELLTKGAPYWPPALQQAVTDRISFDLLLETLLAFSLVKRHSEEHLLSIHRLVQIVQMEFLSPQEQCQWAERLVLAVHAIFPHDATDPVATWSQCLRYLEQVQACDTLIHKFQLLLPEAAELLNWTGIYLRERASYTLAEPLFQRALSIWEQQPEPEHPHIAETLNNLANLYYKQGKYALAEPLYQRALSIREQQVGPDHPYTAESLNTLALLYEAQGKYALAEPLYQRLLHIWELQAEPEHPHIAETLNNLANLYYKQGKYALAEPLFQQAISFWELHVGPQHPYVAFPLNGLAYTYYKQEKYALAKPLFQRALRIYEQKLGPDHPRVAFPLDGLANLCYRQGEYVQAELLLQQTLRIREQQMGPQHPHVAYSLLGLANLYWQQEKYAQAEPLFQRALRIREQQLGPDHPETVEALHNFADFQQAQDHSTKAFFHSNGC